MLRHLRCHPIEVLCVTLTAGRRIYDDEPVDVIVANAVRRHHPICQAQIGVLLHRDNSESPRLVFTQQANAPVNGLA